jgi:hypothetical protein
MAGSIRTGKIGEREREWEIDSMGPVRNTI